MSAVEDVASLRTRFLAAEWFQLTFASVVQQGRVYAPNVGAKARALLRHSLQRALVRLAVSYCRPVSEEAHIANITRLADDLTAECGNILLDHRFRIGSAQEALNLYLKYLWCAGWVMEPPPHCPFDTAVIGDLPSAPAIPWTELDEEAQYRQLVAAAREAAGPMPLAEWELRLWAKHPLHSSTQAS